MNTTDTPGAAYASVYLLDAPPHLDRPYTYYIPPDLRGLIHAGSFAVVPFGGGNRRQFALVVDIVEEVSDNIKEIAKPILSLLYEDLSLDSELLQLCGFLREQTLCTEGAAVRTIMPAAAFGKLNELYRTAAPLPSPDKYRNTEMLVYNAIAAREPITLSRLRSEFGPSILRSLAVLERDGMITRSLEIEDHGGQLYRETIALTDAGEALLAGKSTGRAPGPRQLVLMQSLQKTGPVSYDRLKEQFGDVRNQIKTMAARELISVTKEPVFRDPYADRADLPPDDNQLSEAQMRAFDSIAALYHSGEAKAALLHGITGSGKTRVIKAVMDMVIASGRQVIMLIPEISLTPQTIGYFRACYQDRVAVVHSALTPAERFDMWKRIKRGEVDICIGTRSAVFVPFSRLGMIVIDEEQEHTYKSDMSPHYHARDVARFRCAYHKALMLLASATPSVESYYKAKNGVYSLIELNERYGGARLPEVIIADMRQDSAEGRLSPIGSVLKQELTANLERQEQAVFFLNRRGYNNFVSCPLCGEVIMCPHCSISMTYHTRKGQKSGYLACHYCGYTQSIPEKCPSCGSEHLRYMGFGTQKAEDELQQLFPDARLLRMDADTTGTKWAYEDIIDAFRRGDADILIGTQMVSKGHDFPGVTLSGVLSADAALYIDDFRANERTFSMITQVLGRAGRGDKPGRAVIQTFNPDHPTIRAAAAQDYKTFYQNEIAMRRALVFPPFCDIALITIISSMEPELLHFTEALNQYIKDALFYYYKDVPVECFGPFEAPVYRVNEKYRMRMVIKFRSHSRSRALLRDILSEFSEKLSKTMTVTIDINPSSL